MALHLLLVDDNPDDRALVTREIAKVLPDARVDEAGSREDLETLLAAADAGWDVVVTDYQLRWSTGMDVFRRLRARWPDLPVMLFTASGNEELAVEALKEGVDDYITKTPRHYGRVPYAARACAERSERRRAAAAAIGDLRRREAQLQLAMEAGAMTSWWVDVATGAVQIDRHAGGPMKDVAGIGSVAEFLAVVHADDRPRIEAAWRDALAGVARLHVEARIITAAGERWLEISAVPGSATLADRWVGVVRDVTDAKRQEAELRSADRAKDEFIGMLAHELRNPLASIGYVAPAVASGTPGARLAHARDVIERQVAVMSRLLDDLLDVGQLTRRAVALRTDTVDLGAVVREVVADHEAQLAAAGHRLQTTLPEGAVWIRGDRVRLQEIFANLLSNAMKFTHGKGSFAIALQAAGDEAIVTVSDDGIGIAPDMLERIFAPYVQERPSPTEPPRGLGIGLAIVRELVRAHGGTVRAASAGAGRGATFELRFPRVAATAGVGSADGTGSAAATGASAAIRRVNTTASADAMGVDATGNGGATGSIDAATSSAATMRAAVPANATAEAATGPPAGAAAAPPSPVDAVAARPLRVVVADDEVDVVETLRTLLQLEGHEVAVAMDGVAAQAAAEQLRPDAMVLDIGMPRATGDAVARWVRAQPWGVRVRLVAVSGWGRAEDRARTAAAGFDAHFVKPVPLDVLLHELALARDATRA